MENNNNLNNALADSTGTGEQKIPRPVVLIILDGWGIAENYNGNTIAMAKTPNIDKYISEYPSMTLRASGEAVGLPWGEGGNSEVGHLNLGLGRIIYQSLPKINKTISDGSFYSNPALMKAVEHARKNNSKFHIMGLASNGGVHSSIDHLYALLLFVKKNNLSKVYVHVILDGRDTSYNAGINFVKSIQKNITRCGVGKIATISGRFYAMDRNNNWDRTAMSYLAMVENIGEVSDDPISAVEDSYKNKIFDEEFKPTIIKNGKDDMRVSENDSVVFYNFRPDRARQITKAFVLPDFDKLDRSRFLKNLCFVCFTEYEKGLPVEIAFGADSVSNSLGEVISKNNLRQLRIAETEKYAHVTYFFNGGVEEKMPNEEHILVPSPSVSSYDQKPEMSATEVTKRVLDVVEDDIYDFILINYANADMVGHTGNTEAAIKAVEVLDKEVKKIVDLVLSQGGVVMITADHGNVEVMFNMQSGQMDKEHTSNPVPFILIGNNYHGRTFGWQDSVGSDLSMVQPQGILSDVAPTILRLLNIEKPEEMTGMSLL